ncbi:MAG: hypothetical protein KDE28_18360, partial [Anaerolineales bacterium]|nr:hypothetical protein [Anaerolineales bacterium]
MAQIQFWTLGQFQIVADGQVAPFKVMPRGKALLAYCLLNAGALIPRDELAFMLWPDVTEEVARGRLRRHLYNLRQGLPAYE